MYIVSLGQKCVKTIKVMFFLILNKVQNKFVEVILVISCLK